MQRGETITTEKGNVYNFTKTTNDVNGNSRYIVSWINLGLDKYEATKLTKKAGLTKYRGKRYGGGFVLTSCSLYHEAKRLEKLGLNN